MDRQVLIEEKHVLLKNGLGEKLQKKHALELEITKEFEELKRLDFAREARSSNDRRGIVMLCCLGLVAGFAAGAALGGPWTFLAPIAGFGLGLMGDMTLIRRGLRGISKNAGRWVDIRERELNREESKEV